MLGLLKCIKGKKVFRHEISLNRVKLNKKNYGQLQCSVSCESNAPDLTLTLQGPVWPTEQQCSKTITLYLQAVI